MSPMLATLNPFLYTSIFLFFNVLGLIVTPNLFAALRCSVKIRYIVHRFRVQHGYGLAQPLSKGQVSHGP